MRALPLGLAALLAIATPALAAESADQKALIAMEQSWAKALNSKDYKALDSILADDWIGQSETGRITKAQLLGELKSGKLVISNMVNRNMRAYANGNLGFVQGEDSEKTSYDGKPAKDGQTGWTDIYEKRGGKWVAIASQNSALKK